MGKREDGAQCGEDERPRTVVLQVVVVVGEYLWEEQAEAPKRLCAQRPP